jgi:hypothetical protein
MPTQVADTHFMVDASVFGDENQLSQKEEPNVISIASRGSFNEIDNVDSDIEMSDFEYDIETYEISNRNFSHYTSDSTMDTLTQISQTL